MSTTFRIPDPPDPPVSRYVVKATVDRGRCAGCCVCGLTCWTWWSPAPPSGYAPIHEKCVDRLFEYWEAMRGGGTAAPATPPKQRVGAYARLESAATAAPATTATVTLTGQRAVILPKDFVPGVFWLPGDTADSPWTMLAVTAAGVSATPCLTREQAEYQAARLELLRETSERIPVVGAVTVAPDGTWSHCWGRVGEAPERLLAREGAPMPFELWRPITRMADWWVCSGCRETRWPGTWSTFLALRCLGCLSRDEVEDPRPPVIEPSYPGDRYLPERFTRPPKKLALPSGYRRGRR